MIMECSCASDAFSLTCFLRGQIGHQSRRCDQENTPRDLAGDLTVGEAAKTGQFVVYVFGKSSVGGDAVMAVAP